jgi:putative transposase
MDATPQRQPYASDLTDPQGRVLQPLRPPPVRAGAPRTTDLREGLKAIRYRLHYGCAWHARPHDLPPEGTVRDSCHRWRRAGLGAQLPDRLRRQLRRAEGRNDEPTAAIRDRQAVKGTRSRGVRGSDGGQKSTGSKRPIRVDTLGLRLGGVVHAARIPDRDGAKLVFARAGRQLPTIPLVWAEGGYAGQLIPWLWTRCAWVLELVKRSAAATGWVLLPRRWVVERPFAWRSNGRALARDSAYHPETTAAWIQIGRIHRLLRRLTKGKPTCPKVRALVNCTGV